MTSLLDELMPRFDVMSRHSLEVDEPPERVAQAVESYRIDQDGSLPTRLLIRVRGLRVPAGTLREALAGSGFTLLAERPGREVVFGTAGRFWALRERANLETPADAAAFRAFDRPASAAGAVNVRVDPLPGGGTLLSTETRVRCTDELGRRRFRWYWTLIRIFSGLIRRDLLAGIAHRARRIEAVRSPL